MQSKATTVSGYLSELPADRRKVVEAVRKVILANLDPAYEEGIDYGMLGYYVPHSLYPAGYHTDPKHPLPFVGLASQKNYFSLYLAGIYCGCGEDTKGETSDMRWFRAAWAKSGKKLDMGKSCVRFKRVDDLALDVIGEAIRRLPARTYIERYEAVLARTRSAKRRPATKRVPSKARARSKRTG